MASEKDIRKREKALGTAIGLAPKAGRKKKKGLLARFGRAVKARVLGTSKSQKAIDASKKMVGKKRKADAARIVKDRSLPPRKPSKGAGPKLDAMINKAQGKVTELSRDIARTQGKLNVYDAAREARKRKMKDKR